MTVGELISKLQEAPPTAQVKLMDADTGWTIVKFEAVFDSSDCCFWFYPSEYKEMVQP